MAHVDCHPANPGGGRVVATNPRPSGVGADERLLGGVRCPFRVAGRQGEDVENGGIVVQEELFELVVTCGHGASQPPVPVHTGVRLDVESDDHAVYTSLGPPQVECASWIRTCAAEVVRLGTWMCADRAYPLTVVERVVGSRADHRTRRIGRYAIPVTRLRQEFVWYPTSSPPCVVSPPWRGVGPRRRAN